MKNKIKIIIIDSGVKTNHKYFEKEKIRGYEFTTKGIDSNFECEYGHGTAAFESVIGVTTGY